MKVYMTCWKCDQHKLCSFKNVIQCEQCERVEKPSIIERKADEIKKAIGE